MFRETFTGTVSREKRRSKEIRKEGRGRC